MSFTMNVSRSTDRMPLIPSMHAPGERVEGKVKRGRGVWLTLEDGRDVLDVGSMSSCILGHCHPDVVAAVQAAAETVYVNDGTGWAPREQAAVDLLDLAFAGEEWADSVVLTVSSSEAGDLGLLLAQMLTGRTPLASRELSYHGGVGLARELSAHPLWGAQLAAIAGGVTPRPPGLFETRRLPLPLCGVGHPGPDHDCDESCLLGAPETLAGTAAVMLDATQGGVHPSAAYYDKLAGHARDAGALFIADETVTAFGRLGHGFAFQRGEARPDMVTLGKGITAGATPGGALVLSREVADEIGARRWMTASTFRGNPMTVAAMSAVQHVLQRDGIVEHAHALGTAIAPDLAAVAARHPSVESICGAGLCWIVRLHGDPAHDEATWGGDGRSTPLTQLVHEAALEAGVMIGVLGGQCVWMVPPLIITGEQLADAVAVLDDALTVADRAMA